MTGKPTWKDTKREYLLMLIKEGDLSNSQLDDIIREARRMTSDRAHISKVGSIEDMRRIVEAYNPSHVLIPDGMALEQAVRHLEHGPKALEVLKKHCICCKMGFEMSDQVAPYNESEGTCANKNIVNKMEGT